MDEPEDERLPVHLLSGFLGAGKTTLLNRLLSEPAGARLAVVVNEFGELPIDGKLVVGADDDLVLLRNGCVCCSVRGDLVATLRGLLERRTRLLGRLRFDRFVIEASGLASPGPVLQTLLVEDQLAASCRGAGVVTLCHAGRVREQLGEHPEAEDQVGYADLLVVNHTDELEEAELAAVEAELRARNSLAPIHRTRHANLDPALVFEHRMDPRPRFDSRGSTSVADARHTPGVRTVSLEAESPLDLHRLKMWLRLIGARRDHTLLRVKGYLHCSGRPEAVIVQGMYQWLEIGPGPGPAPERSALVLIGRDLDVESLEVAWRGLGGR